MKNSLYKPILAMLILFSIVILPPISANTFAYNYLESNPSGDQDLSTYVEGNMSAETYNETIITPTTNYSLSFDGVDGVVKTTGDIMPNLTTTSATINFWVYYPNLVSVRTFEGQQTIIASGGDNVSNPRWFFTLRNNAIQFRHLGEVTDTTISIPQEAGNWQMITGIFNTNLSRMQFFKNGVYITQSGVIPFEDITNKYVWLGYGTGMSYFNGSIDEVLIFNRSLSSDEISQLYNSGNGLYANTSIAPFNDGLVAGWHFDEGTGTTAYDITGRNNGTLVNGPTWVDGKISHNLTSTTETLGVKGLMPYLTANNFISTGYALKWDGSLLLNIWNTISTLGNSTNRWNIFAWNLTADKYFSSDGTEGWTGNCVNAIYKDGLVVGCND